MKLKRLIQYTILVAGNLAITCAIGEVALRIVRINSPSTIDFVAGKGLRRVPGSHYLHTQEGRSEGRFNSHGFRDSERTLEKPTGDFRIEVFGDSFVEGLQVALVDSFPARLERAIRASGRSGVEVLNLGQSGFGTTDECLRFLHFGKAFSPDLVVVAIFVGNDIRNNSKTLNAESLTYYYVLGTDGHLKLDTSLPDAYERNRTAAQRAFQAVKRHSYLASLISERLYLLRRAKAAKAIQVREGAAAAPGTIAPLDDLNLFVDDPPQVWKDSWAVTQAVLLKFRDDAEAAGARFVVVTIPSAEQIDPAAQRQIEARVGRVLDWTRPDAILVPFAREHGIPILPLAPIFGEAYARNGETLYGFGGGGNHGHWNERGHALAATTLLEFLQREGLIHD